MKVSEKWNVKREFAKALDQRVKNRLLEKAVDAHDFESVEFLVENGVDVNIHNGSLIRRACKPENTKLICLLLKLGAKDIGNTVLLHAVSEGDAEVISCLLKVGGSLRSVNGKLIELALEHTDPQIREIVKNHLRKEKILSLN